MQYSVSNWHAVYTYYIVYDVVCSGVQYRIQYHQNLRCCSSKPTVSYVKRLFLPIVCMMGRAKSYTTSYVRRTMSNTIFKKHTTSLLTTYDIVRQWTVLAKRMYDVTYNVVYDIVGFLWCRLLHAWTTSVFYDVVRDVLMSYLHIAWNIRYMRMMYTYDIFCDLERCDILPGAADGAAGRSQAGQAPISKFSCYYALLNVTIMHY